MRVPFDINPPLIKPFKCDSCHMGFTQQTDVQRHFDRIHKKLKPFTCELCQEKFARNYELKQHLKTAHTDTIVDSEKSDNEDDTVIRTEASYYIECVIVEAIELSFSNLIEYFSNP